MYEASSISNMTNTIGTISRFTALSASRERQGPKEDDRTQGSTGRWLHSLLYSDSIDTWIHIQVKHTKNVGRWPSPFYSMKRPFADCTKKERTNTVSAPQKTCSGNEDLVPPTLAEADSKRIFETWKNKLLFGHRTPHTLTHSSFYNQNASRRTNREQSKVDDASVIACKTSKCPFPRSTCPVELNINIDGMNSIFRRVFISRI